MPTINVNVSESLWENSMLPEGIVERWFIEDGGITERGHRMAEVRIEEVLHDIVAPATGRLSIQAQALHLVEPGQLLATIEV